MARKNATADADPTSLLPAALTALLVAQVLLPADALTPAQGAGLPQVMLWLLLLLVYVATRLLRGTGSIHFAATDVAVGCLLCWHTVAALYACWTGAPRPAINVLWEWVGIACGFFLVRQLARSGQACRALAAVMIGLAMGLAAYGYYQVGIEIPQSRREYEADPDKVLRDALQLTPAVEISPLAKKQFKDRLDSPQPYATFALANSLAGYLSVWLVVAIGVAYSLRGKQGSPWQPIAVVVAALAVAGTLLLTDSRTAYLAALFGLILLVGTRCGTARMHARGAVITAFITVALAATVMGILQLDNPRAVAVKRSLLFRWHYWQATTMMIAEHPLLGAGPGDFKQRYTAYKLPEAYEEVGDPHNFLLELGGTAGVPAMVAMLAVLGCFYNRTVRRGASNTSASGHLIDRKLMAVGAFAGFALSIVLVIVYGLIIESVLTWATLAVIAVPAGMTMWILWQWISDGDLPLTLVAISVSVLLIHLCASGGIGNHGVAGSLWLLIAIGLNLSGDADHQIKVSRNGAYALVFGSVALALACQWTALAPVVESNAAMSQARQLTSAGTRANSGRSRLTPDQLATLPWQQVLDDADPAQLKEMALERLTAASADDPWSSEPRRRIVWHHHSFSQYDRESLRQTVKEWLERDPYSSQARREAGDLYWQIYRATEERDDLLSAIQFYQDAVDRYPNSNILVAQLAWLNTLAGRNKQARQAAARALELDAMVLDADHKLGGPYHRITDPRLDGRQTTTEQRMQQILDN